MAAVTSNTKSFCFNSKVANQQIEEDKNWLACTGWSENQHELVIHVAHVSEMSEIVCTVFHSDALEVPPPPLEGVLIRVLNR